MIKYLSLAQNIQMHDAFIDKFGGLQGIRDKNLLLAAIETPKASMFGEDLYPSLYDKAAAYLYHIVQNLLSTTEIKEPDLELLTYFLKQIKCKLISMIPILKILLLKSLKVI